ncbi:hypothetical protein [Mycolicibacterium parafortuitum]|uniref:Uncharacterized protein n=1 Tax=Mycolicibacterium parafortuitum TaxID=39692 RepID=A0A375YEJ2_MYCPF|nr:hypothetical protein [Mycolicibacterium parafortuitum]SRX79488.1 hypothetical protein [Rhodococcus jostii RHA1] [Mycolicibacterium parafortuitum]
MSALVVVAGPPRAGVSAMVAALNRRPSAYRFTERPAPQDSPAAALFVVSAVAPMAESDCALADLVAARTPVTIPVLAKVDDHRDWRRVRDANLATAQRCSVRLAGVPWVGAAAAPRLGEPQVDDVLTALDAALGDPARHARAARLAAQARLGRLGEERDRLVRTRRQARLDEAAARRHDAQQARLALTHGARRRCAALRTELLHDAAAADRRALARFPARARQRCADVLAGVDDDIAARTGQLPSAGAAELDLVEPPAQSWRLERRLTAVLGAGFGLGVALVVTRFVAGLAPGLTAVALVAGAAAGLATTTWVVRARTLLHDRAVLAGWVGEAAAAVRAAAEERIGTGLLVAETGAVGETAADRQIGRRIAALDAELRQLTRPADLPAKVTRR